jgi:hypothetical protein
MTRDSKTARGQPILKPHSSGLSATFSPDLGGRRANGGGSQTLLEFLHSFMRTVRACLRIANNESGIPATRREANRVERSQPSLA